MTTMDDDDDNVEAGENEEDECGADGYVEGDGEDDARDGDDDGANAHVCMYKWKYVCMHAYMYVCMTV